MKYLKLPILILFCLGIFLLTSNACWALNWQDIKTFLDITAQQAGFPSGDTLPGIIIRIIDYLLGLLGLIAVVMIMYGGFQYLVSAGEEKKVTKAKNTLKYAIIGLAIIILSLSITNFIFSILTAK